MTHMTIQHLHPVQGWLSTPTSARESAACQWRQVRNHAAAMARMLRQCVQHSIAQSSPPADKWDRQFRRDVLRIEARRLM